MNPQEAHEKAVWLVLKKIKEKDYFESPIKYPIDFSMHLTGSPDAFDEEKILKELISRHLVKEVSPIQNLGSSKVYSLASQPGFEKFYQDNKYLFEPETVSLKSSSFVDISAKKDPGLSQKVTDKTPIFWIKILGENLVLNDEYILSRPMFDSENFNFIEFFCEAGNITIAKEDLRKKIGGKLDKTITQVLRDLNLKKNIKRVFFPNTSSSKIRFRNNLTNTDLKMAGIDRASLKMEILKLKKIKK